MTIESLKCEYAITPLGIDAAHPRFSWTIETPFRAQMQSAYRILVAGSPRDLADGTGDTWDSGRVESDRSVNVPYAGGELASTGEYWWKVRVWDRDGRESPWSEPATFEMGLLSEDDWQGQWIAADPAISAPLFRKEFHIDRGIRRARAYVCGLGYHECRVNGRKVGDAVMDPAPSYYDNILGLDVQSRVLYVTHDVTELLGEGPNTIGVMLGHGWYSSDDEDPAGRTPFSDRPILLVQLDVEFTDGGKLSLCSDASWKAHRGPITANDIAAGEHYDARLEQPGWDTPGHDDSDWAAVDTAKAPSGRLVAQSVEPIKVVQRFQPTRILKSGDNAWIFDIGQYVSGWTELHVNGPGGTKVTLRHAARVNYENQSLDTRNSRGAPQVDSYILKGGGPEVWHPRFTIHGFRYVEVDGYPGEPTLDAVVGCAVNSALETTGRFECSNTLLNRIHHNVYQTFRGSFQGIPQDAAERAERVGWLGDPGFVAEDYMFNFGGARFWAKWLDDIHDAQKPDGQVPFICPANWGTRSYRPWPCWECSYTLFIWFIYQYYDDPCVLDKHYEGMRKQVECFGARAEDGILAEPLGDHMEPRDDETSSFSPTRTPPALTGTAYYQRCAWILAQAAGVLGREEDAARYSALADQILDAFNREFFDPESGQYGQGSQTANALALYLDLVPQGREEAVLGSLLDDIHKRRGHLSTGIIGTDALEQALPKYGRADVMYEIATKTTFPSWGYGVVNGQTTISEDFECSPRRSVSMKMLGSVEKFFYQDLAGIGPASPGWRTIRIRPGVVGDLTSAIASVKTVHGPVAVDWRRSDGSFALRASVPANTSARVHVPGLGFQDVVVRESGETVWAAGAYVHGADGISNGRETDDGVVFDVGSGSYVFEMTGRS